MNLDCVRTQLLQHGYALIPGFLTEHQLEALRLESEVLYELAQEGGRRRGGAGGVGGRWGAEAKESCIYEGIPGHLCTPEIRRSYDVYKAHRTRPPLRPEVWHIMFRSQLPELVHALLGPGAVLFNDQYIIKPPLSPLSSFRWHRDSDWCRTAEVNYAPYISVWIALDDMTQENGCFVVQPGSHRRPCSPPPGGCAEEDGLAAAVAAAAAEQQQQQQQQHQQQHKQQQQQQQQRAQPPEQLSCSAPSCLAATSGKKQKSHQRREGEDPEAEEEEEESCAPQPALPLRVAAGTAIVTSDTVLHCSRPNCSRHVRRAWMPQFSAGPISWAQSGLPVGLAVPLQPGL